MTGVDNGQRGNRKPNRHNAKLCPFTIRQRIINALANGDSIRAIARALHVSNNTVVAIRDHEWQQVAARKETLAAQAETIANRAADALLNELEAGKVKGASLVPVFGVAVDKALALRGDSLLTVRHEHFHRLTDDDIVAFAVARSKRKQIPPKRSKVKSSQRRISSRIKRRAKRTELSRSFSTV